MKPFLLLAALALVAGATPAAAGSSRYIPRPPVQISPDLAGPWLVEIGRDRPRLLRPRAVETARAPSFGERGVRVGPRMTAARTETPATRQIDPAYLPAVVSYEGREPPGTIIIDTEARYLYLVLDGGKARRYGVGVGRPGFEWAGVHRVTRKAEWPDWTPPEEMRRRQPGLPTRMAGGPDNPLGARALYLGSTLYRIHGSNQPWTIGQAVSSGCIRMRNEDVIDLYERVRVGARVIVS